MKIDITTNNIHITDSYKIQSKKEMEEILTSIKTPDCQVFKRKMKSLIRE